jgi:ornithine cyclodeaminase/alanine dehydrogenase-like protein (mu-crystallin family)
MLEDELSVSTRERDGVAIIDLVGDVTTFAEEKINSAYTHDWSMVRELGDVVAHGMPASDAVPVFKTVGQAAWDLAAARVALGAQGSQGA